MGITVTTTEAKENFIDHLNEVVYSKEPVILTRRGKAVAALIPIELLQLYRTLQDKHDLDAASEALKEARVANLVTLQQIQHDMD